MKARSFSHTGITVSDFNKAVQFYWDVFGCPLVGVADTPPERVRTFFGVTALPESRRARSAPADRSTSAAWVGSHRDPTGEDGPSCKIGWIRVPGGAVLE